MKTVKIGKKHYKIRTANLPNNVYGTCLDHTITVSPKVKGKLRHKTVLHEILHGCVNEYCKIKDSEDEEDIVYAIEKGFSDFARHNPEEWIILAVKLAGIK